MSLLTTKVCGQILKIIENKSKVSMVFDDDNYDCFGEWDRHERTMLGGWHHTSSPVCPYIEDGLTVDRDTDIRRVYSGAYQTLYECVVAVAFQYRSCDYTVISKYSRLNSEPKIGDIVCLTISRLNPRRVLQIQHGLATQNQ